MGRLVVAKAITVHLALAPQRAEARAALADLRLAEKAVAPNRT
jgi:hypothetical protein